MVAIVGLDVGDKRVGVALADTLVGIASPYNTFDRSQGKAEAKIIQLINEREIGHLVVGLPLGEDGAKGPQCLKIEKFCGRIERRVKVVIHYVDEYLSSAEAHEIIAHKPGGGRRMTFAEKGDIDKISAAIILQRFLDSDEDRMKV